MVILVLVVSYEVPFLKKTVLTFFYAIFDLPSVNVMRFLYKSIVHCEIGIFRKYSLLKEKRSIYRVMFFVDFHADLIF